MNPPTSPADPLFFPTAADFRRWLAENHDRADELWVGVHKIGTGRPSITWPESVDEALCFGWIDGIRKKVDEESYTNRFTPRRPDSRWSAKNVRRMEELIAEGRVEPAGMAAYDRRTGTYSYSYEQRYEARFSPQLEERLHAEPPAWEHLRSQPPGYRQTVTFWVMSAKREETRRRRMEVLVESSAAGRRIPLLGRPVGEE